MLLRILGSAAGGGFPQWNCGCPNCRAVREARAGVHSLTQSSIAVRAAGGPWFLVNASPDVRQQLERLHDEPLSTIRSSPIAGVLLTDAEIDHTTGLVILRESAEPLRIYGTNTVKRALTDGFGLLRTLQEYCGVEWSVLEPGTTINLALAEEPYLEVEVFPLPATPPKYMRSYPDAGEAWAVGFTFRDPLTGGIVTYAPALAEVDDKLLERFESSDCILVDGTFWHNQELPDLGITVRTAQDMGHLPLFGSGGSLERLAGLSCPQKILIHINNTNPILIVDSAERRAVETAGITVGYDGLTIEF